MDIVATSSLSTCGWSDKVLYEVYLAKVGEWIRYRQSR